MVLFPSFVEKFREKTQGSQREKLDKNKASRSSSNASTSSKQRRKFIKNIRPDTFRRPSSYSCSEAEAITAKDPVKDCMLVGYRKIEQTTNVTNVQTTNRQSITLGTFTPTQGEKDDTESEEIPGHPPLATAASMPSLFQRNTWSRTSITSLPDFSGNTQSPHTHRRTVKSALIKNQHIHSDSEVYVRKNNFVESETLLPKEGSFDENQSLGGRSNSIVTNGSDKVSERDINCDIQSTSSDNTQDLSSRTGTSCKDLANEITKALNDKKDDWYVKSDVRQNDDVSDDETCVANGYDDILEKNDFSSETKVPNNRVEKLVQELGMGDNSNPCLSKDSGIITQDSDDSDHEHDKITVAEFLRNEYIRLKQVSDKTNSSTDRSDQTSSDTTLSLSQHRASSDSNIIKSLESSTSSVQITENKGVHPSKSFPELLSHAHNDAPRLVSQIGHATLR